MPRKKPGRKSITTSIPEETHERLKEWAEENYWSVSKAVEVLIERGLKGLPFQAEVTHASNNSKK
jgi:hypothetical protein